MPAEWKLSLIPRHLYTEFIKPGASMESRRDSIVAPGFMNSVYIGHKSELRNLKCFFVNSIKSLIKI